MTAAPGVVRAFEGLPMLRVGRARKLPRREVYTDRRSGSLRALANNPNELAPHLICLYNALPLTNMATLEGKIPIKANPNDIGGIIPLKHLIDQHVYRSVAHTLLEFPTLQGAEDTIADRFKLTFNRVTGFSPRLANRLLKEQDPIVSAVRYAESVVQVNVFPGLKRMRWDGELAETDARPFSPPAVRRAG